MVRCATTSSFRIRTRVLACALRSVSSVRLQFGELRLKSDPERITCYKLSTVSCMLQALRCSSTCKLAQFFKGRYESVPVPWPKHRQKQNVDGRSRRDRAACQRTRGCAAHLDSRCTDCIAVKMTVALTQCESGTVTQSSATRRTNK